MNFQPDKFFVGLMDFFSILLPGALLTHLLMDDVGPVVPGDRYAKLDGPQACEGEKGTATILKRKRRQGGRNGDILNCLHSLLADVSTS